jgi:hypothetical protein
MTSSATEMDILPEPALRPPPLREGVEEHEYEFKDHQMDGLDTNGDVGNGPLGKSKPSVRSSRVKLIWEYSQR